MTDWAHAADWMTGVENLRADGPLEVGTSLVFTARGKERRSEIVDIDPGRLLTLRSVQGGVTADYRYEVEPVDDGSSTVSLRAECATTGAWSIVGPVIRRLVKRTDGDQPDRLKALVERS
jgi:hypothetical protein